MQRQAARLMRHATRDFHDVILYDQDGLLTPWGFGYRDNYTCYQSKDWINRCDQVRKMYIKWDEADEYATQTRKTYYPRMWSVTYKTLVVNVLDHVPLEFAALRHKHEIQEVQIASKRHEKLDLELVRRLCVTRCLLQGVWPLDLKSLRNITHMELNDMHVFPGMKSLTRLRRLVLVDTHFGAFELRGLKLVQLHVLRSEVCLHTLFCVLADMTSLKVLCIQDTRKDENSYVQASSLSKLVKLTNLERLELEDNLLSGSLPCELAMLTKLESLYVEEDQDNQLFDRNVCQEILDMKLATLYICCPFFQGFANTPCFSSCATL
jgi:hypothetical protein